jgi:hypothetical protein
MAYTAQTPADVFASWAVVSGQISVPVASFNNLTNAAADAATGDARETLRAICQNALTWYNGLAEASNNPLAMSISLSSSAPAGSSTFFGKMKLTYSFTFYVDWPDNTVADEPA